MNIINLTISFLIFLWSCSVFGQGGRLGAELQVYPAGIIVGPTYDFAIKEKSFWSIKVAYNFIRRQDFGEHEDERGWGIGTTLGYYYRPFAKIERMITGLRSDLWYNRIHWKDNVDMANEIKDDTKILVVQPTGYVGYECNVGAALLTPHIALGAEINAVTSGTEVGQGPILLLGLSARF